MKLTQVRNATLFIEYAGTTFLIDPMLAEKDAWDGFAGTARSHIRNPMTTLPIATEALVNADIVIVTHTHMDHWDEAAQKLIPSNKLIYAQHEADAELIRSQGFTNVRVLQDDNVFTHGLTIHKVEGQHGSNEAYAVPHLAEGLGDACGLVFTHHDEKTLYIAGDTVWVKPYLKTLQRFKPDVVVLNTGDAHIDDYGPIIMGAHDTLRTLQALPETTVVASHMEAINHCLLTRQELREYTQQNGIEEKVLIPEDGDTLTF
ncbi:MBL fold metallo-hydrolase [Salmonella enterica]|nr:MBL fold metallo-hydrolase [Salmonella enterica]ECD0159036.1 MBL fold metallo-hydrolase [Salmonella enterica subsp. enterica]ECD4440909.1 MBL fold metallo-hydrolase [Salmonella enterica subsp. enterica serovar Florida]ECH9650078.1 MBL fold metallo-hydrolase [Salmonella enterica subsp. enterica serovar Miami]ECX3454603.1 MBL fold metallo-hydrolase [Salmonella enterica subsp. enterica serovar Rubislaw]EDN5013225.1 MBL fold metallo-hydrolase [Salmonella enterica subsp. enterica serovar Javiana